MLLHDTNLRLRNPQATMDLFIPVEAVPTVPVEKAMANASLNSWGNYPWLNEVAAHDGIAEIVGKGPSLAFTHHDIFHSQYRGSTVFACNSASEFLEESGIRTDYQIFLDPHPRALDEMRKADCHLLASTVDPSLFAASKNKMLWQPDTPGIEAVIPSHRQGSNFTYIGGGVTVMNSALCLAYTLGFRDLRVHGMDSSFDEHNRFYATRETLEGRLRVTVEEGGVAFKTTYDMKQQVIVFLRLAKMLKDAGCKIQVHGSGLLQAAFKNRMKEIQ